MNVVTLPDVRLSFVRYAVLAWRFTLKTNPTMWLLVLPLLSAVAGVAALIARPELAREMLSAPPLGLLVITASLVLIPFQMHRQYRRTPLLSGITSYELSERGLRILNAEQATQLRWDLVPRAYRFGPWLVLQTGQQQGFFLDLRRVQAPHAADHVLHCLQHHGVELQ